MNGLLKSETASIKTTWIAVAVIVALNLLLKGWSIGVNDIAMDEPFTLFWAQQPLSEIWELAKRENNPPLHFVVEHFWIEWFGMGAASVRFPSLFFSALTAGLLFWSGNRHFGWKAGLGSSLLFSLSVEHMYYAHEARAYAMLCLFTLLALDRFLGLFGGEVRRMDYVWLGLWNILLIYTHFLGFWVLLAQGCLALFLPGFRKKLPWLLLMVAGVALAYSPNLYAFYLRLQSVKEAGGTWVQAPHWTQLYGHINYFLNGKWVTAALAGIVLAGLVYSGVKGNLKQRMQTEWVNRKLPVLLMAFLLIYGGMYVQSLIFSPTFIPRYLLFSSIPLFMAVGAMIFGSWDSVKMGWVGFSFVLALMLPGFSINPPNNRDMKGLARIVQEWRDGQIPLVICPGYFDLAFMYHLDRAAFEDYSDWPEVLHVKGIYPVSSWAELPESVREGSSRILFVDADSKFTLPENGIVDSIRSKFGKVEQVHVEQIFDVYFAISTNQAPPTPAR